MEGQEAWGEGCHSSIENVVSCGQAWEAWGRGMDVQSAVLVPWDRKCDSLPPATGEHGWKKPTRDMSALLVHREFMSPSS